MMFAKALGQFLGTLGRKCCARKYDHQHYMMILTANIYSSIYHLNRHRHDHAHTLLLNKYGMTQYIMVLAKRNR